MKKSLTQALGLCAAVLLSLASCKKDETKAIVQPGSPATLTTSANNVVLLQTNSGANAVTYTWTPVTFGYQAVVTYSLQFDKKGGDFSSPISFDAGSALTKTLTVSELNSVYQSKNLVDANAAPTSTSLDARVVATIGGSAPTVASAATTVMATPYASCEQPAKAWSIIGDAANGWNAGNDITMTYDCVTKTYSYTGPLKAKNGNDNAGYKFRYNKDWTANLGGTSTTGGPLTQNGDNLSVASDKTYTLTLTPGTIKADGTVSGGSYTIK
ncbi:MAG: hypothetical protein EOO63_09880 [Hymenobacter sp.]|nr:MAG: hypothetical protein EOO63_09880 [Hymenobacter sp.]